MKTGSLVLGIIGGVLAIIFAIVFMVSGSLLNSGVDAMVSELEADGWEVTENPAAEATDDALEATAFSLWGIGIASIVAAILGIVGGAMAKKKNVLAGILMLIAAIPSAFTGLGIVASLLFLIGAILAFIPAKKAQNQTV